MVELVTLPQTEQEFCSLIEQLAADASRREELIDLLREDHPLYDQRGAAVAARLRGWVVLALARSNLPDAALPFVLEELDTGIDAYLVATAAFALRSHALPNPAFAPFVVRAIGNIRYRDQRVSLETYGGYVVGSTGTTAVRELLETLVWLGPQACAVASEVKLLRGGPSALPKKYGPDVTRALDSILQDEASDCCQLPQDLRHLFSFVWKMRTNSQPIDSVLFEDHEGAPVSFREFFHGRPSIVVFFYTRCDNPLKCSLTITKLARIQELLATENLVEQINTAGITYDPGFDLPERLRNYGRHRGLYFAPNHRLLRACDGLHAIRQHFKLGVNFIESLVNRHRIEVYILDTHGRIAASFERVQWSEKEVVQRAIEVMKESASETKESFAPTRPVRPTRFRTASPVFATVVALALTLFPKCPLCWAAYASMFGIAGLETIPYSPWLQPVLAFLLFASITSTGLRARSTGRFIPFYLVIAGALATITAKLFAGMEVVGLAGVVLILIGSFWGTFATAGIKPQRSLSPPAP